MDAAWEGTLRRITLLLGITVLLSAACFTGRAPTTALGAPAGKQSCKTVNKTVHGKKKRVKVCHAAKPVPKPTATATPTPTPTPTATSSTHNLSTHGAGTGIALLSDDTTNNSAAAGSLVYGPLAANGTTAPSGSFFQWVVVVEQANGTTPYLSSVNNFRLTGDDGAVYPQAQIGNPEGTNGATLADATIAGPDGINTGWVAWSVPQRANTLTVSWNEGGLIPWKDFAQITVKVASPERVTFLKGSSYHVTARVRALFSHMFATTVSPTEAWQTRDLQRNRSNSGHR